MQLCGQSGAMQVFQRVDLMSLGETQVLVVGERGSGRTTALVLALKQAEVCI